MIDPNKTQKIFNYKDIAKDRLNETPKEENFINDPYPKEEVEGDLKELEEIKAKENHDNDGNISDSEIHEYATQQEIGEMDWFHEGDRSELLFPDGKGHQTTAFLTSDYDDHISHVDVVCVMDNSYSAFSPIPFALDLTYRSDVDAENSDELDKKFSWKHPDKNVNCKGFCKIKYFEDTFNGKPLISKGKIDVLPRFVVGYSEELAGRITEERMTSTGWESLPRIELSTKAKFCVLHELVKQSGEMAQYLEDHHGTPELQQMQKNINALNEYFSGALKTAQDKDKETESYIYGDTTTQSILRRKIID